MASPTYLRLGSGETRFSRLNSKAKLLDRARRVGLPVPAGVIIPDSVYHEALRQGLVVIKKDCLRVSDATQLARFLDLPYYSQPVAVRATFSVVRHKHRNLRHESFAAELFVDSNDPAALGAALARVWESGLRRQTVFRRDVLITTMVSAQHTGLAFSESAYEDDLVLLNEDPGEKYPPRVDSIPADRFSVLPKLYRGEYQRLPDGAFAWNGRLQRLLRDVRRVFGDGDWELVWADDGVQCWLVEMDLLQDAPRRNDVYVRVDLPYHPPSLPSFYMNDILQASAVGMTAFYHRLDPRSPVQRPILDLYSNTPYLNLSFITDTLRRLGLPLSTLANWLTPEIWSQYIQTAATPVALYNRINGRRLLSRFRAMLGLGLYVWRSRGQARRTERLILERTAQDALSFVSLTDSLQWFYTRLGLSLLALNTRIQLFKGVLGTHIWETGMARYALRDAHSNRPLARLRAKVATHPEFQEPEPVIGNSPSFWREAPDVLLLNLFVLPRPAFDTPPRPLFSRLKLWLTAPLWWQVRRTLRAREHLFATATLAWQQLREQLGALAATAAQRGQLPEASWVWALRLAEVKQLDAGWSPHAEFFARRELELDRFARQVLPPILHAMDTLESPSLQKERG